MTAVAYMRQIVLLPLQVYYYSFINLPSLSKLLMVDLTFIFRFSFYFIFIFYFLFLEQLRLGFISHKLMA